MRNKILKIIRHKGSISNTELTRLCRIDETEVESILTDLEADGLIKSLYWFYSLTWDGEKECRRLEK